MSNKTKALLGLGLLLVAVLGYWKFGGKDEAKKAEPVAVSDTAKPAKAVTATSDDSSKSRGDRGETAVLLDDDPEGQLRLEGQVINATEDPVAGAIVSIDSEPPRFTKSEADGSFFFDKLVGKEYTVVARASVGAAGPLTVRLTDKNDPVTLTLKPGGEVTVKVVAQKGGEGIAGAHVELRDIDVQDASADGEGTAVFSQVPTGRHGVVASAPGYAMARSSVAISRPGASAEVRIELRKGARVAGIVVDPEGAPLPGARVTYHGASEWSFRADPRLDGVTSDAEGRFAIEALPAGSFRFDATAEGFAPGSSELVELDGDVEKTGVEIKMAAGATLRGKVVDNSGQPVPAARVRIGTKSRGMRGRGGGGGGLRQAYTEDDGSFEITGLPRKDSEVVALHESASSEILDVDLSEAPYEVEQTLTLDIDGVISGIVVDSEGEPVAGAQVMVFPDWRRGGGGKMSSFRMRGISEELTDAGGAFAVHGLEEGPYQVRAVPANAAGRGRAWLAEGVEAKAGETDVKVVLPKDGGVKGKVAFANGDVPSLFTVSVGWRSGTPFSSKKGDFELPDLPPQEFTVTVRGPDFDDRQVRGVLVEEGKTTDLGTVTVSQGRKVAGRVLDPSGSPVEGAMVQAGRVIFGDGSSSKAQQARNPMARSTKNTTTDENGQFAIYGVTGGDLSILAEAEGFGRSRPITVQQNRDSITEVTLQLLAPGALEGIVTRGGTPQDGIILTASPLTDPGVTFNVATGADGKFRFDKLTPDTYKVAAMTRGPSMRGMGFISRTAVVEAGQTSQVEIPLDNGGISLVVNIKVADGDPTFTWVAAMQGKVEAPIARDFYNAVGSLGEGYNGQGMSMAGQPARLTDLSPGLHTVCAIPYPKELEGREIMDYVPNHGDDLEAFCKQVTITEAPEEQSIDIQVTIPDLAPSSGE